MLNEILDSVSWRLKELFGDETTVYTDPVEQDIREPYFYVGLLEPEERPMIGRRYYRSTKVTLLYHPGSPMQINRELYRVSDILLDGMEYITMEDGAVIRGTGRKSEIKGGVLNFLISYGMFVIKPAEQAPGMDDMESEIRKG